MENAIGATLGDHNRFKAELEKTGHISGQARYLVDVDPEYFHDYEQVEDLIIDNVVDHIPVAGDVVPTLNAGIDFYENPGFWSTVGVGVAVLGWFGFDFLKKCNKKTKTKKKTKKKNKKKDEKDYTGWGRFGVIPSPIFGVKQEEIVRLTKELEVIPGAKQAFIHGSKAGSTFRGRGPRADSDVDVILEVTSERECEAKIAAKGLELIYAHGNKKLNIVVTTKGEIWRKSTEKNGGNKVYQLFNKE